MFDNVSIQSIFNKNFFSKNILGELPILKKNTISGFFLTLQMIF